MKLELFAVLFLMSASAEMYYAFRWAHGNETVFWPWFHDANSNIGVFAKWSAWLWLLSCFVVFLPISAKTAGMICLTFLGIHLLFMAFRTAP